MFCAEPGAGLHDPPLSPFQLRVFYDSTLFTLRSWAFESWVSADVRSQPWDGEKEAEWRQGLENLLCPGSKQLIQDLWWALDVCIPIKFVWRHSRWSPCQTPTHHTSFPASKRNISSTNHFIKTTLHMQWLPEVSNHCWFWLIPSRFHSRDVDQEVKKRKDKSLVQANWYKSKCSTLKCNHKRKHKDSKGKNRRCNKNLYVFFYPNEASFFLSSKSNFIKWDFV